MNRTRLTLSGYGALMTLVLAGVFCCEAGMDGGRWAALSVGLVGVALIDAFILWIFVALGVDSLTAPVAASQRERDGRMDSGLTARIDCGARGPRPRAPRRTLERFAR